MGKIKRLAGDTVLYGLGSILPRFLNFLLVTLHTSVFAAAEYGVITKLYSYIAVINTIFLFGMETAYFRFSNKPGADEQRIFNLAQTVVVAISLICSLLLIVILQSVADLLSIPEQRNLVMILIAIMFIDAVVAIPFARLRHQRKPLKFATGKLINVALFIGLNYYLLKLSGLEPQVSYVLIANLIANSFYLLLFFNIIFSWQPSYDKQITPQMFSYGYPILITGLAGMTNEMFSRIMLDKWLPDDFYSDISKKAAVGIFGACYKLATLMNLTITAFRFAAEPFFFSQSNEKNSPQLFARVNHYFIIVCCFILLAVSINLDILKYFLAKPEYWHGMPIVPILLLAYLFLGIYYNYSVWFKLTDKTYYGTIITAIGLLITIGGNFILIPLAGYLGSSIAAFLCYFVMAIICYGLGQKYYPIPYSVTQDFTYIVGTVLLIYAVNTISIESQLVATLFHLVVMLVYAFVIFMMERKSFVLKRA